VENSKLIFSAAIQNLYKNTGFRGRWQIISEKPLTICDVAHNPAGIAVVMEPLQKLPHANLHIIIGFANDKELDEIISLLPKKAIYYATQAQIERALPAEDLFNILSSKKLNVLKTQNISQAYHQATHNAQDNDVIFIGGSFFVVSEFLKLTMEGVNDLLK
jgi:dihydrofolate synthase/folylpolyglutamate synthase